MQKTEAIIQALHKLGVKRSPLTRVYRHLFNEDMFIKAYAKIYRNAGSSTKGIDNENADGMSLKAIQAIIEEMRYERFHFLPVRVKDIPKKSGGIRKLGIPTFKDRLVQEVLRMLLEAYYEPQFRDSSHGYRPERGCHTALKQIKQSFRGAAWFIEGDIKGCFDNIDHEVLMQILGRDIEDGRLLELIRRGLKAGKLEEWDYQKTLSGTPQGGILSPLLANIYMNELDVFVEDVLIPQYTKGEGRRHNPLYRQYEIPLREARDKGDKDLIAQLEQERRQYPSRDVQDPNFRRLKYVRYADDFILAFIGSREEAENIRQAIGDFLKSTLKLELSAEKTVITHAKSEKARFLNYDISIYHVDDKISPHPNMPAGRRSINGHVRLGVPFGFVQERSQEYMRKGKTISKSAWLEYSDAHIIDLFQSRFRGLVQYYQYAVDLKHLGSLKHIMQQSLVKTLAHKFKISVPKVYQRYRGTQTVNGYTYKTLNVTVPTEKGRRIVFWGAIPLRTKHVTADIPIQDELDYRHTYSTDLVKRLQANVCEICGSEEKIEVHHIRKLGELKQRWQGRKEKPIWVQRMIALQRKTLIVCRDCHEKIHAGKL